MKNNNITHIIFEGVDGVGKSTIVSNIWQKLNFQYRVYDRGDISDYVYAKKYKRNFISTQRGLPFLYVLLIASKQELARRINLRQLEQGQELDNELIKIDDQELFIQAAKDMSNDYHIITIDTTELTIDQTISTIIDNCKLYINSLSQDLTKNEFNKMYAKGCKKANIQFKIIDNQPYFNNQMIMCDAQLHNGIYETFDNKTCPHNLVFSLAYSDNIDVVPFNERQYDFAYPINSKILVRPEMYEYMSEIIKNKHTLLTTKSDYIFKHANISVFDKVFGNEYIKTLSNAKATIYTARDLAYLEMITVRAYEATLAKQIIFVDTQSDVDNKILKQIYNNDENMIELLSVTPKNISLKYNYIITNTYLIDIILTAQTNWYNKLKKDLLEENNK